MPMNFTVVAGGKINDEADDAGDIAAIAVTGWLHFVAQLPEGMPALAPTDTVSGTSYWISTFKGYFDTDGVLKTEPGGTPGVRIWANDPAFSLEDPGLPYLVYAPDGLRANGKRVEFKAFVFYAPSTDVTRKLSELQPVPSATAEGLSRGLQGEIGPFSQIVAARVPDALISGAITRDSNGAPTTAAVRWPDGTPGTYVSDVLSTAFPGAVDGYHITYGSPVNKTYTQPAITRDASGAPINIPAIVES